MLASVNQVTASDATSAQDLDARAVLSCSDLLIRQHTRQHVPYVQRCHCAGVDASVCNCGRNRRLPHVPASWQAQPERRTSEQLAEHPSGREHHRGSPVTWVQEETHSSRPDRCALPPRNRHHALAGQVDRPLCARREPPYLHAVARAHGMPACRPPLSPPSYCSKHSLHSSLCVSSLWTSDLGPVEAGECNRETAACAG